MVWLKSHAGLTITSLSEEVGILHAKCCNSVMIGDRIEIIPNHSCPVANMTSYLIGVRKGVVERYIEVDMRGNSRAPAPL